MLISTLAASADVFSDTVQNLAQAPGTAGLPGQNMSPQAPSAFSQKADRALNFGQWIALLVGVCGLIAFGAGMFFSRSQGGSEEQVKQAVSIGVGALIVSGAGGLLATLVG